MGLTKLFNKTKDYGKLVMFSHTIFSFSFALISMVLAANGLPSFWTTYFGLLFVLWELVQVRML